MDLGDSIAANRENPSVGRNAVLRHMRVEAVERPGMSRRFCGVAARNGSSCTGTAISALRVTFLFEDYRCGTGPDRYNPGQFHVGLSSDRIHRQSRGESGVERLWYAGLNAAARLAPFAGA